MSIGEALLLVLAGIGGGLAGSIAGLASIATYPALLAVGLPAVTANVTNTVALVCSSAGSVWGSRPELVGQGPRVRRLAVAGIIGGATGGLLLLVTPADSFEKLVPWLIAFASVAMLARRRIVDTAAADTHEHRAGTGMMIAVGLVGVYGGYFGAGAGVMMLALFLWMTHDTMPRANAVKNVILGLANGVAAIAFVFFGDVRWTYVLPLGLGLLVGGRVGPIVVRRAPVGPLRVVIAVAGLGLAVKLGLDAYR
jgi:uncharacterized membrane protein YfcA